MSSRHQTVLEQQASSVTQASDLVQLRAQLAHTQTEFAQTADKLVALQETCRLVNAIALKSACKRASCMRRHSNTR